jgi:hypothetical protein
MNTPDCLSRNFREKVIKAAEVQLAGDDSVRLRHLLDAAGKHFGRNDWKHLYRFDRMRYAEIRSRRSIVSKGLECGLGVVEYGYMKSH